MADPVTSSFLTSLAPGVLFKFLEERIGIAWSTDLRLIGRVVNGKLVGVIGFNNITGSSCQMHFAGDRGWISRHTIQEAFTYAFDTLKCKVVYGLVESGNTEALETDKRLGFKEVIFLEDASPKGGTHLLQMRREDCRFLRKTGESYGQINT